MKYEEDDVAVEVRSKRELPLSAAGSSASKHPTSTPKLTTFCSPSTSSLPQFLHVFTTLTTRTTLFSSPTKLRT